MEFVRTCKSFDHLSSLKIFKTYRASILSIIFFLARRSLFFLFILKARDSINYILNLIGRQERLAVFIDRLIFFPILVSLVKLLLLSLILSVEIKLLVLPIRWECVGLLLPGLPIEHPIEVHVHVWVLLLNLTQHVLNIWHDPLKVYEVLAVLTILLRLRWLLRASTTSLIVVHVRIGVSLRRIYVLSLRLPCVRPASSTTSSELRIIWRLLLLPLRKLLTLSLGLLPLSLPDVVLVARMCQLLVDHIKLSAHVIYVVVNFYIIVSTVINVLAVLFRIIVVIVLII